MSGGSGRIGVNVGIGICVAVSKCVRDQPTTLIDSQHKPIHTGKFIPLQFIFTEGQNLNIFWPRMQQLFTWIQSYIFFLHASNLFKLPNFLFMGLQIILELHESHEKCLTRFEWFDSLFISVLH